MTKSVEKKSKSTTCHFKGVNIMTIRSLIVNHLGVKVSLRSKRRNALANVAMLYIVTSFVILSSESRDTSGCFQCFTLMNREWNGTSSKCSGTKSDCGRCIQNYVIQKDGKCTPATDTIIVKENGAAFIPNGSNVILSCEFSEMVDCAWSRRGFHVNIGGRYSFLENPKGEQTKNCSIQIKEFNEVDTDDWNCKSMADSMNVALTSTSVELFNEKVLTAEGKDKTVLAPKGSVLILECRYKELVDCAWSRNGHFVTIRGRYQYLNDKNAIQTDVCSIKINSIKEIDAGRWECNTLGDSSHSAVLGTSLTLQIISDPAVISRALNISATDGTKLVLNCTFDAEVECQWHHNGNELNNSRLLFTENNNTNLRKNCSIELPSVSEEHSGAWTCNYRGATITPNATWLTVTPFQVMDVTPEAVSNHNSSVNESTSKTGLTATDRPNDWTTPVIITTVVIVVILVAILITVLLLRKKQQNKKSTRKEGKKNASEDGQTPDEQKKLNENKETISG